VIDKLKEAVREHLEELELVIGYGEGYDPLHATPIFVRRPEEVDRLLWNPLCVYNLATYLYGLKGKKVGVVVKGCDSRSVLQLLNEGLISREEVFLFGLPCSGVLDLRKLAERVDVGRVEEVSWQEGKILVRTREKEETIPLEEVLQDRCLSCPYPTPLIYDVLLGDPLPPKGENEALLRQVKELEELTPPERLRYWKEELERCIRCYACRNACPLCVCQDWCAAEARDPHWISMRDGVKEKWMWQVLHALHLAGRCTGCGECERACPMGIPLLRIRMKINAELRELFDYEAGVKEGERPPLLTYQVSEPKIEEPKW